MLKQDFQSLREQLFRELSELNFSTYFTVTHAKHAVKPAFRFNREPVTLAVPYKWRYRDAKEKLLQLKDLLKPEEAERCNIQFVNPGLKDLVPGGTLTTLRGGIQMLQPGELAYTHRHSANAFRFVLEAPEDRAYTMVEGHRLTMHPGDLILTPNWTWHDHHNDAKMEVIWFDGLDVIIAAWLGGVFYQDYEDASVEKSQQTIASQEDNLARYGYGLKPAGEVYPSHLPTSNNRLLYYPYQQVRHALSVMAGQDDDTLQEGVVMEYVNPLTGGPAFPTMSLKISLIKPHVRLNPIRRTVNSIYVTFEGHVNFELDGAGILRTGPFDVVAIPSWARYRISNADGKPAIVFSYSDEPVFKATGLYREERAA